jgi:lipopolysaccharide biosynthesis protein
MNTTARVIAFYLPQFHPTPENNQWWGNGFTEWTNVARAKKLYRDHYQPHVPADLGFYDLRLPEARAAQAELAQAYGVEGFCYYHYWFAGRRILERPFEEVLRSGEPDLPFCLCWANHSWNSIWQGTPDKMLIEQTYPGPDDHIQHFNYLLKAFSDPRYIQVDGKPLFLLYKPDAIPDIERVTDLWRSMALKVGLKGLYLVGVAHFDAAWDPRKRGLDAVTMQKLPPRNGTVPWRYPALKTQVLASHGRFALSVYDYGDLIEYLLRSNAPEFMDYPLVLPNWDNTPRSGMNGLVLHGSTPELFRQHLQRALAKLVGRNREHRIVFLKAWNEWAEGNYVEPDQRFGHGYLQAIKDELEIQEPRFDQRD